MSVVPTTLTSRLAASSSALAAKEESLLERISRSRMAPTLEAVVSQWNTPEQRLEVFGDWIVKFGASLSPAQPDRTLKTTAEIGAEMLGRLPETDLVASSYLGALFNMKPGMDDDFTIPMHLQFLTMALKGP